jgi:hypothetical protein
VAGFRRTRLAEEYLAEIGAYMLPTWGAEQFDYLAGDEGAVGDGKAPA